MAQKHLVTQATISIAGYQFTASPEHTEKPGSIVSIRVEFPDQRSSRTVITVRDVDNMTGQPFPIYNALPDPLTDPDEPFEVILGWEDDTQYQVFQGLFHAKEVRAFPHRTELVGIHETHKMKREGKSRHWTGITLTQLMNQLASEYNVTVRLQPQLAAEPFMQWPVDWIGQGLWGEQSNWQLLKATCDRFGLIMCSSVPGVVDIREDKSDLTQFTLTWGVDEIKTFESRNESRTHAKSGKRKGHGQENIKGQRSQHEDGQSQDGTRNLHTVPPRTPKKGGGGPYKDPFHKASVTRLAHRLGQVEGRSLKIGIPLRPDLNNLQRCNLSQFGPRLDGVWELASVEHEISAGRNDTRFAGWRNP
ncbi:MAG: hypothetical protein ACREDR_00540 [Blastocatellia bacterium]